MLIDLSLPLTNPSAENVKQRDADLFQLGHYGTHLNRLLNSTIPLNYFISRALLFNVSDFAQHKSVESEDVLLEIIEPGDFIIFHTGAMGRNPYASKAYLDEFIEFSWDLLTSLLEKNIHFIGLDARGLRRNEEHRQADILCEESGTFVIENLNQTELLPYNRAFTIYTSWFDTSGTGIPCKVIAELD